MISWWFVILLSRNEDFVILGIDLVIRIFIDEFSLFIFSIAIFVTLIIFDVICFFLFFIMLLLFWLRLSLFSLIRLAIVSDNFND